MTDLFLPTAIPNLLVLPLNHYSCILTVWDLIRITSMFLLSALRWNEIQVLTPQYRPAIYNTLLHGSRTDRNNKCPWQLSPERDVPAPKCLIPSLFSKSRPGTTHPTASLSLILWEEAVLCALLYINQWIQEWTKSTLKAEGLIGVQLRFKGIIIQDFKKVELLETKASRKVQTAFSLYVSLLRFRA